MTILSAADLVFVDSSAWFATVDRHDPNRTQAVQFLSTKPRLITTDFVVDETVTLVRYKLGHGLAVELGDKLWNATLARLVHVSPEDESRAWLLFRRFRDKRFSFTDCSSFVVMQRLGLTYAFAFDDDFSQVGRFVRVPG